MCKVIATLTAFLEKRFPITPKAKQIGFTSDETGAPGLRLQCIVSSWMLRPFRAFIHPCIGDHVKQTSKTARRGTAI